MRAALGFARLVVAWVVIFSAGGVLLACVVIPRVAGATPYAVQTGSMRPTLPPGTLVVVRPVPPQDVGVGSVITYQLESGRPQVTTHRVVEIGINNVSGERTFRTRGDANEAVDPEAVRAVQVRGEVWYAVPFVGRVNDVVTGPRRLPLLMVVACLLGYAVWMFIAAGRERRAARREKEGELVAP